MINQTDNSKCPVCGADCLADARLCRSCGTRLTRKEICANCGAELRPGAKFCGSCGSFLGDMEPAWKLVPDESQDENRQSAGKEPEEQEWKENSPDEPDHIGEQPEKKDDLTGTESGAEGSLKRMAGRFDQKQLAAMAAAVVLLIFALILILPGMGNDQVNETDTPQPAEQAAVQDEAAVQEGEQEPDLSGVTLNLVDYGYAEVSGIVDDSTGTPEFIFETPQTIYLYDTDTGEAVVVDSVAVAALDPESSYPLQDLPGRKMRAAGEFWIEGDQIVFNSTDLLEVEPEKDDPGIHQYQVVIADCTWQQAFDSAVEQGGYLARISSAEEYQHIVNMLNGSGYTKIHFYLGGRRDDGDYYWVNTSNEFIGEALNSSDSWCSPYWFRNEPSYVDTGSEANGEIPETVMNLFYVSDTWYLNDSADNLPGLYPSLLSGKVGYLIEYEE